MIQRVAAINDDNQPAKYGPVLWDVLNKVALSVNGVTYVIGLFPSPMHYFLIKI